MKRGNILGGTKWGQMVSVPTTNHKRFEKGNQFSLASNMSEEANRRRLKGILRGSATRERQLRGERVMLVKTKQKIVKRQRERLRENLQAEARDIQNLARTYATEAMEKLFEIVQNSAKGSDVIAATALLLERAYGKATQTSINANLDANGKPTEVTSKELDVRITEALKRVENLTGRAEQEATSESGPADVCVSDRDPGNSSLH